MKYNFFKLPLIFSIILLVLSCSLLVFLYSQIRNNNVSAEQMKIDWQLETERRENLESLEKSLQAVDSEIAALQTHYAQNTEVAPFLDMIEKLASSVGGNAEVVGVDFAKDNTGLTVQVKANGDFESLYKFITLLENSPYEIMINSIDIKNVGGLNAVSGRPEWSANLGLKLLSFIK